MKIGKRFVWFGILPLGAIAALAFTSGSSKGMSSDLSSCCRAGSAKLVCGKTGEILDTCCCETRDEKLVCTKTGEVLETCCCTAAAR